MVRRPMGQKLDVNQLMSQSKSAWIWLQRRQGQLLRGLLCWTIGCMFLLNDENKSYDSRMRLRGPQEVNQSIILVVLNPNDISTFQPLPQFARLQFRETTELTDSYYWNQNAWHEMLKTLLSMQPKKIGVTLMFSDNLVQRNLNKRELSIFQDPRITWAAQASITDRLAFPLWTNADKTNIGAIELTRDDDGILRRFSRSGSMLPHFVERISEKWLTLDSKRIINYRGNSSLFPEYSLKDILSGNLNAEDFKDKVILIGSEPNALNQMLTPLGFNSRLQILAQIVDNVEEQRWVVRFDYIYYVLWLLLWMIASIWILNNYPQKIAFFFLSGLISFNAALSALAFDQYYFWLPILSVSLQTAAVWVVFVGYHATRIEQKNWALQQEQKYLHELEQLKNNFVSLISHDLKTPIAKIQAVANRLLTKNVDTEFSADLASMKKSSEELNRYIQSILKVLRVESRDFKLNLEIADLNETITEAIQLHEPLAKEKNIQLHSQLEPLFSVEYDIQLMREVVGNLIENAIKYTPNSGNIYISSKEVDEYIEVHVQDTGEGIATDDIKAVWGKFVRGKDQDLKSKGSGLGLYLVKYFIELHGGKVSISSQVGQGTRVTFQLPLDHEPQVQQL